MGTWGTDLYADDLASDVRQRYRDLVAASFLVEDATRRLLTEFQDVLADDEHSPIFWLALADTQWKTGHLEERVRNRALEILDSDLDQDRWRADPSQLQERKQVLEELRERLLSPPPPKRLPKPFIDDCDWQTGEIFSYELKSGKFVLFRVAGIYEGDGVWTQKNERTPIIEILDWIGDEIPDLESIRNLAVLPDRENRKQAVLFRLSRRDTKLKRFSRLGIRVERETSSRVLERLTSGLKNTLFPGMHKRINRDCPALYAKDFEKNLRDEGFIHSLWRNPEARKRAAS